MDLLNLSQPWDCERFPKSKTICYGGSSGTSTGDNYYVKKAAKQSGYTGSDLDKAGQATEKAVTGGVKKAEETVKEVVVAKPPPILKKASEGFDEFGRRIKKGVSAGVENIKKEGNKAVNQIKSEAGKLAKGDFSLKNAVTGTISGASETFKKSDAGKVVKKIADQSGYTGSDADKALQKTEKEVGNVGNQALDVVNNPGKAVLDLADKGSKYVKRQLGVRVPTGKEALAQGVVSVGKALQKKPTETKAGPGGAVSIGGGRGLGTGAVQGLQGGAGMDTSRARARQNKRKLRIR